MHAGAFQGCSSLTDVTVEWATPSSVVVDDGIFSNVNTSAAATLHVPTGTECAYAAASVWCDFNIIGAQRTITATAGSGGTVSPSGTTTVSCGGSQTFTFIPNTSYEINQVLVDGTNNAAAVSAGSYTFTNVTSNHTISVGFASACLSNIVVQVWDDVLSVINNPANNGGYTFIKYQWFKNGVEIPGETGGNLYLVNDADRTKAQYTCRVTASNNQVLQTCPFTLTLTGSAVRVYPNPTQGKVVIAGSTLAEGDRIDVYNSTGRLVNRFSADAHPTEIDLAYLPRGIYVIAVNGERVKIVRL